MIMSSLERNVAAHILRVKMKSNGVNRNFKGILDYVNGNLLHEGDITTG